MASTTFRILTAAAVVACAFAPRVEAATVFSLGADGTSLIRFDSATPGTVTTVGAISGATNALDGLDFRPSNGLLYGYSNATGRVYTVDTNSGAVSFSAALSIPTGTAFLGIDFNPQADRLRIVTATFEQNLRVNVANGLTFADGTLAYAAGDTSFGVDPNIIDAAYTNSSLGTAASTALYYVDYGTNSLVKTSNPNAGVLDTVGLVGFDFDQNAGFDIFSDGGTDTAFAAFRVGGANGFYNINLATGAATLIGAIGNTTRLWGLAVVPGEPPVGVPEPGSLALLGAAGLAAFAVRRRLPAAPARAA